MRRRIAILAHLFQRFSTHSCWDIFSRLRLLLLIACLCVHCGSGRKSPTQDSSGIPAELPEDVVHVELTVVGSTDELDPSTLNVARVTKDASAESRGDGAYNQRVKSIKDTAEAECSFGYTPTSANTGIDIVDNFNQCTSLNKCIICIAQQGDANCVLSCGGTIPSSTATAEDYFELSWTMETKFTTKMKDPDGVIRFDGAVNDWPALRPNGLISGEADDYDITYDLAQCSGPSYMEVLATDPLNLPDPTETTFNESFDIHKLNNKECFITVQLKARIPFTGADEPGATIHLTGTSNNAFIASQAKICDDGTSQETCPI